MRTKTLANTALVDPDGHKTTVPTVAAAVSYTGAALNGADTPNDIGVAGHGFAFYPTATLASQAGAYVNGSTITWTGTYRGEVVTRTGTIVGTDGNITVTANGLLDTVTQIDIGAQANTNGAFTFGWTGMYLGSTGVGRNQWHIRRIVVNGTAGNLVVDYLSHQDTLVSAVNQAHDMDPLGIVAAGTTATTLSVYYE